MYSYMWVQGAAPPNSTEREGFCVRSTDYTSKDYSTWTESRWKVIKGRIFLVASHDLEADILFSSGREPANATY
ncbi:hypothetical protein F7725_025790 [Dissostichus mawsoni]|uniref:Uncharacterized protein n=1 Tax=Dissostichus mawsoni TaxID=36200 RepID=A0A7J5X591_DISMA|nr:hypothetical protein F7725_025790 [Dissostichus mawsoni]